MTRQQTPDPGPRQDRDEEAGAGLTMIRRAWLPVTGAGHGTGLTAGRIRPGRFRPGRDVSVGDLGVSAVHTHWWIERAKIPGQQSVVVLGEVLHQAWQVPLEPDDRLHLGASLACFDPALATSADVMTAVHEAEQAPAGPRSLPGFDNNGFLDALAAIGRPPDAAACHDRWPPGQGLWGGLSSPAFPGSVLGRRR